ncbi:unnamed protein product [Allacma fusca]|uniref:SET domain-containing protein n=1 Tax=Allacma fusca TaxID=39272 RepID=A0A8J2LNL9_9HEXA|nr:unnamed protein product [Allacma fusca]
MEDEITPTAIFMASCPSDFEVCIKHFETDTNLVPTFGAEFSESIYTFRMSQRLFSEELPESSDELSVSGDIDSGIDSLTPSPLTLLTSSSIYSIPDSAFSTYSLDTNEADFERNVDSRNSALLDLHEDSTCAKSPTLCVDLKYRLSEVTSTGQTKKLCHEKVSKSCWRVRSAISFVPHQIILMEEPLVILPCQPWSSENPICINCGALLSSGSRPGNLLKKINLAICIICKWPMCQNGCDFEEGTNYKNLHSSLECSLICKSNLKWSGSPHLYQYLWILRMSVMKRKEPVLFHQMLELSALLKEKSDRIYLSEQVQTILKKNISVIENILTKQELLQICKILMYGFRPMHFVGEGEKKLRALYFETSAMSHSCDPNVEYWVDENYNQTLVAVRPIKVGEVLTISFMDELVFLPTPERRRRILENFNIWCKCNRCEDPTEFRTNFSSPVCRLSNAYFISQFRSQTPLWTRDYLYPTNANTTEELRTDYQCPSCYQVTIKEKIIRWEKHFEDWIYHARNNPNSLRKLLCKVYRQKKIHHTHFLFFRASWRLLQLLSEQLTQSAFLDEGQYLQFVVPAESVHQVFKAFMPSDIPLSSRVLRTVSLIKLALLTDDIQVLSPRVPEVQAGLSRVYFTNDVNLTTIFKYYESTKASDLGILKGTFDWVEHCGIEKFVHAVSTCRYIENVI